MQKNILMTALFAVLVLASCSSTKELEHIKAEAVKMSMNQSALSQMTGDQLEVDDGFDYLDSKSIVLDLNFTSKGKTTVGFLQVDIAGLDGRNADRFYSGMTDIDGRMHIDLDVSNRYRNLLIIAKFRGEEKKFRAAIRPSIQQEFTLP